MKLILAIVLAGAFPAAAQTIDFEATCGGATSGSCSVGTTYSADGVSFTPPEQTVCMGNTNGDPGNWGLEGTNGAKYLCFNGTNPGYSMEIALTTPVLAISMDVARSNGSQSGDSFTIVAYNGATQLATQTVILGAVNSWSTVSLTGFTNANRFTWTGNGAGFHPYGVDNIVLDPATSVPATVAPVPALSEWALMALGVAVVGVAAARKKKRA